MGDGREDLSFFSSSAGDLSLMVMKVRDKSSGIYFFYFIRLAIRLITFNKIFLCFSTRRI